MRSRFVLLSFTSGCLDSTNWSLQKHDGIDLTENIEARIEVDASCASSIRHPSKPPIFKHSAAVAYMIELYPTTLRTRRDTETAIADPLAYGTSSSRSPASSTSVFVSRQWQEVDHNETATPGRVVEGLRPCSSTSSDQRELKVPLKLHSPVPNVLSRVIVCCASTYTGDLRPKFLPSQSSPDPDAASRIIFSAEEHIAWFFCARCNSFSTYATGVENWCLTSGISMHNHFLCHQSRILIYLLCNLHVRPQEPVPTE